MEVTIRPKNFKLQSGIESQIRKRVERLPRHLDGVESAEVVLSQQPTHLTPQRFQYVIQLTLHTSRNLLRSEVSDPELLTGVDQAMNHVSRQIERFKGRSWKRHKGVSGLGKASADMAERGELPVTFSASDGAAPEQREAVATSPDGAEDDDEEQSEIVRVKKFGVTPMFPDEAIEQMELLGHSFFAFWNAADEQFSVVYRRKDGDYGLIQPELK